IGGSESIGAVAQAVLSERCWFEVTPCPGDRWLFRVKEESKDTLYKILADTGVEPIEEGALTKRFKVVAISNNTNSFGLGGVILCGTDGETWQVGANDINAPKINQVFFVPATSWEFNSYHWEKFGFEIPEKKENAPIN